MLPAHAVIDYLAVQDLFVPVVERLGLKFQPTDSPNDHQLRTLATEQAAIAGDPKYVSSER